MTVSTGAEIYILILQIATGIIFECTNDDSEQ